MSKEHYYVSVVSRTIEKQRPEAEYMEIEATPEELDRLEQLFVREEADDQISHLKAPIPYKSNDREQTAVDYSDDMRDIYTFLYQIGTPETKRYIEETNLLEKLQDTDYDNPGYEQTGSLGKDDKRDML